MASYSDYEKSTYRSDNIEGGVQFSDAWNTGARYQQLKGISGKANADLDAQFAALGSPDAGKTGTVADDGDGWVLLKQDKGTTDKDRVNDYRNIAEKWQAAGYDVRVQDHNPEFGKKKQSEIAIRKTGASSAPAEPEDDKPSQALTRARAYVAQKDFSDMVGETTQSKFGYNPVSGSKSWTREDGKGIAANFLDQYQTRVKDLNYEVNPDETASGQLRADATGQGPIVGRSTQTPESQAEENVFWKAKGDKIKALMTTPVNEQAQDTLGMP